MANRPLPPAKQPIVLRNVETLNGDDIGKTVRFYTWDAQREIATMVTAELRQLSHNQAETHVTYGVLAEREYAFQRGELISVVPPFDYSDAPLLRQELCDFHGIEEDIL
jgi:hypothetical protein